MTSNIYELQLLLNKVLASEDLVRRAEAYFKQNVHQWSAGVASYFQDFLARKKDQIEYEWHLVYKMGSAIAAERAKSIEESFDP